MPGPRLSLDEREFIEESRRACVSMRAIAAELGRSTSTVSRELRRNRPGTFGYHAPVAHGMARRRARRPKAFKLERHRDLARWVERLLRKNWSPDQIAKRLRKEHPDDPRWWVSPEAIYGALYVQGRGALKDELTQHLRRRRTKRRHGKETRGHIPDMVMIAQRPPDADDRAVPGHWEGDLIIGARHASQVGILTERTTRYTLLFALPRDRSAATVAAALTKVIQTLPKHLVRSLTWDQGGEMADHKRFTIASGIQVYFCDPGHPWQRGTAENTVGLVRQYLPKGFDLSTVSPQKLAAIAIELNGRPRKTLDYDTPAEVYSRLVGVATTS